jgi:hypothetical protein
MSTRCTYYSGLEFITIINTAWCVKGRFGDLQDSREDCIEVSVEEFDIILELYG